MRSIACTTVCALLISMGTHHGLSIAYGQGSEGLDRDVPQSEFDERAREFRESRKRELEKQEQRRREQKDAPSPTKEPMFTLDEQLQQAWDYFSDFENRRRDVAVDQFQAYIRDHPDTFFLPEIYFRIGQLYCSHRNEKYKEEYNREMMVKYYQLAIDSYGSGYTDFKYTAWASIVNQPEKTLKDRSEFYDWLCSWNDANEPNDIYPVKPMAVLAQGRSTSPYWDENAKLAILKNTQKHLPQFVMVAEKNIFQKSTAEERLNIIIRYPNTEMTRQIKRLLSRDINSVIDNEVNTLMETGADVLSARAVSGSDHKPPNSTAKSSSLSDVQAVSRIGPTTIWTVGCLSVLSLVLLLASLQRVWRSANKKT